MNILLIITIGLISGILGTLGGSGLKQLRIFVIPTLLTVIGLLFKNFWSLLILAWMGIFSIGYGVPDVDDEGSVLGKFWYNFWKGNRKLADIFTKLTLGIIFSFVLFFIGLFSKHLLTLLLSIPLAIISQVVFGGFIESLGSFKIFGKEVNVIEFFRYGVLGIAGCIQIIGVK
jgi:hypothetical protein